MLVIFLASDWRLDAEMVSKFVLQRSEKEALRRYGR